MPWRCRGAAVALPWRGRGADGSPTGNLPVGKRHTSRGWATLHNWYNNCIAGPQTIGDGVPPLIDGVPPMIDGVPPLIDGVPPLD